jgi:hypothetical protein
MLLTSLLGWICILSGFFLPLLLDLSHVRFDVLFVKSNML